MRGITLTKKILILSFIFLLFLTSVQAITVQRGETAISTTSLNVTVNTFTPENTLLLHSLRVNSNSPGALYATGTITNSTTITFDRFSTNAGTVSWELIEDDNFNVQRGVETTPTTSASTMTVHLAQEVNLSRSFIVVSSLLASTSATNNVRSFWTAEFVNSTAITLTRGVTGSSSTIAWQVVEWDDAIVQRGVANSTNTPTVIEVDEVVTNASFLITSTRSTTTSHDDVRSIAKLVNETHIELERFGTTGTTTMSWFLISSDRAFVQRGDATTFSTTGAQATDFATPINTSNAFTTQTLTTNTTGNLYAESATTIRLFNETRILLQKNSAGSYVFPHWQVIEIEPIVSLFPEPTPGIVPFYCIFRANSECLAEETLVLRASNDTGGFNNAHVQHANQTPIYANTLCCNAQNPYVLSNSCASEDTQVIASIASLHDAHIQIPPQDSYLHGVCLGSTFGNFSCTAVNGTCAAGYTGLFSLASSESNAGAFNYTNAHIGEPDNYLLNVCCQIETTVPLTPELIYPTDGNDTVFERNVTLLWSEPFEPDGDAITYDLQLNVSAGACSVEHDELALTNNNFTTDELCVDQLYTWSVRACDIDGCSGWAESFNFTIASTLGITFINNQTTFASLIPGETNDTEAGPGQPLHIQNTGNIVSDVELNATGALFNNAGLDTEFFQFKVAEETPSSYVSAIETYTNVTSSLTTIINSLNYVVGNDEALIHLRVTVPADEVPGVRSTTLIARVSAS